MPARVVARIWKGEYVDMADLPGGGSKEEQSPGNAPISPPPKTPPPGGTRYSLMGPMFPCVHWDCSRKTTPQGQTTAARNDLDELFPF